MHRIHEAMEVTRSTTCQMDRPTPPRQQQCSHCDSVEASHWSRSLDSDAAVRADYALTTTTTTTTMEVRIERFRPHAIDIFVFVCIYVLCFCAATDFSVNKDLYNSEILCVPKNVHLFIF